MFRNQSAQAHQFSMIPRADIPRSKFRIEHTHKTTFDAGKLIPIYVDEILPGDSHNLKMTAFARLATPIVPVMDNLHLETFFFFVPTRLVWENFQRFMGEQPSPGDSISFLVPQVVSPVGGFAVGSIYDHFGLPTVGQVDPAGQFSVNVLPLRCYNLIYNQWFRDQNLIGLYGNANFGDGPDLVSGYATAQRGKRHDYFTSCLPWSQKGTAINLPLGTQAPIKTQTANIVTGPQTGGGVRFLDSATGNAAGAFQAGFAGTGELFRNSTAFTTTNNALYPSNLYADLTAATASTVNQLRQSFQIQKLLERDARGGTRYTELIRAHFGVTSPDARLQRPEYLGGGHTMINIREVTQTQATQATITPLGTLSAVGTATAHGHGFRQSFTEHGYVIGLMSVRADLTYQQGLRKLWSRSTRYDFYFPVFAMLGEQAVLNKEIYNRGVSTDNDVFGYQERWAEYRYNPSLITGLFRSTSAGTLDIWHLAQNFTTAPALNATFINEDPPVDRIIADPSAGSQFLLDAFFTNIAVRPLPAYSVPGLIDHF